MLFPVDLKTLNKLECPFCEDGYYHCYTLANYGMMFCQNTNCSGVLTVFDKNHYSLSYPFLNFSCYLRIDLNIGEIIINKISSSFQIIYQEICQEFTKREFQKIKNKLPIIMTFQ